MPRLNNDEKTRISRILENRFPSGRVARQFNVARSMILRLVQRVNAARAVFDSPPSGAPLVASVRKDNLFVNVTFVTVS